MGLAQRTRREKLSSLGTSYLEPHQRSFPRTFHGILLAGHFLTFPARLRTFKISDKHSHHRDILSLIYLESYILRTQSLSALPTQEAKNSKGTSPTPSDPSPFLRREWGTGVFLHLSDTASGPGMPLIVCAFHENVKGANQSLYTPLLNSET